MKQPSTIVGSAYFFVVLVVLTMEVGRLVSTDGPVGFPGILLCFATFPTSFLTMWVLEVAPGGFDHMWIFFTALTVTGLFQATLLTLLGRRIGRPHRLAKQKKNTEKTTATEGAQEQTS
ncbi:SCO4225 family membrane protein [Haloglycomyces albus]|uniref:SCO4225 family membrane protein n=1 Tax=Haloglycomyces albus TaxID=526067 RepID=UPI00046D534D